MKKFIGISLIVAIGFFLSGSRGLVLGATSLFVFFYVFKTSCKTIRRSIIFLFPLIAVCYLVFLYQFSFGPIETYLDKLSSFRFSYVCPVLQSLPVTWFGNPLYFAEASDPFDNSYAWCLLVYGIVGATVFLLSVFLGLLKNINDAMLLALCSAICIVGLIESRMTDPVMSFPMIKILIDGWDFQFLKNGFNRILKT